MLEKLYAVVNCCFQMEADPACRFEKQGAGLDFAFRVLNICMPSFELLSKSVAGRNIYIRTYTQVYKSARARCGANRAVLIPRDLFGRTKEENARHQTSNIKHHAGESFVHPTAPTAYRNSLYNLIPSTSSGV
jgi:hypothetical protein